MLIFKDNAVLSRRGSIPEEHGLVTFQSGSELSLFHVLQRYCDMLSYSSTFLFRMELTFVMGKVKIKQNSLHYQRFQTGRTVL